MCKDQRNEVGKSNPLWCGLNAVNVRDGFERQHVPRGLTALPVFDDIPSFDSRWPFGSQAPQCQQQSLVVLDRDSHFHHISWRSIFGATPTAFRALR